MHNSYNPFSRGIRGGWGYDYRPTRSTPQPVTENGKPVPTTKKVYPLPKPLRQERAKQWRKMGR